MKIHPPWPWFQWFGIQWLVAVPLALHAATDGLDVGSKPLTVATGPGKAEPLVLETLVLGSLGSAEKIEFEGNATFPSDKLRNALRKDMGFVLASHPAEPFAAFPKALRGALIRGYLDSGFPDVRVDVVHDPLVAGGRMLVRISEGTRYRMGAIHVAGTKAIDVATLQRKLTVASLKEHDNSFAGLIRKTMGGYSKFLPPLEEAVPVADPAVDRLEFLKSPLLSSDEADWIPGDPVSFSTDRENPLIETIRQRLAEMGHPLVELKTTYVLGNDGKADLSITIEREGPVAMIGRIQVLGGKNHSDREITEAAGLRSGDAFNPQVLDAATVSLWDTGRFFPFEITSRPSADDEAAVELVIRVVELKGTPHLTDKVPEETEAVRRFITTVNDWLCTGTHEDFLWASGSEAGGRIEIGVSSSDGVVFRRQFPDAADHQWVSASQESILFDVAMGERKGTGSFPGLATLHGTFFHILPDGKNEGDLSFGVGLGLSSQSRQMPRLGMEILLSPSMPFLKPEKFRREGDHVIFQEGGRDMLFIDIRTALPADSKDSTFVFRNGAVREIKEKLVERVGAGGGSIDRILESYLTLVGLGAKDDKNVEEMGAKWVRLAALLVKPKSFKQFKDLFAKWSSIWDGEDGFSIPVDPADLPANGGMMQLLVSLGAISLSESIAPPGSWVSDLGREIVFIHGGKTKHTERTLERLLADHSMGPYGALVASRFLSSLNPEFADRFLTRSMELATADGFRRDWKLWLDSPLGMDKALEDFLSALGRISPDDEREAMTLLEPAQAQWLREFLLHIRSRPPGGKLADWIAPQMDALWTSVLVDSFRNNISSKLNPEMEPSDVVARVNGKPVRKLMLTAIRDGFIRTGPLQAPAVDPAKPWTSDRVLALAVRMELILQEAARRGMMMTAAQLGSLCATRYPELQKAADEEWVAATGLSRSDMMDICGKATVFSRMVTETGSGMEKPDDEAVRLFYQKHGNDLSRVAHVHEMFGAMGDGRSLTKATHAARLVRQAAARVHEGLPFRAMASATAANERVGLKMLCVPSLKALDLSPALYFDLQSLTPGQTTDLKISANNAAMVRLEGWTQQEVRPLDEVKDKVLAMMDWPARSRAFADLCEKAEAEAEVVILPEAAPDAEDPSIFKEILISDSYSAVGQLGTFWEMAVSNHQGAKEALEGVIFEGFLEVRDLVMLADTLLGLEQVPLAVLCLREARDRDTKQSLSVVREMVEIHKADGTKGQQNQLEALINAR